MAYAIRTDLIDRLGGDACAARITDPITKSVMNVSLLDEALSGALALVDSYLARRYRVPVDAMHVAAMALLRTRTLDLAELQVWSLVGIPERVQVKYEAALLWLRDVAKGVASIPAPVTVAAQTGDSFIPLMGGSETLFNVSMT